MNKIKKYSKIHFWLFFLLLTLLFKPLWLFEMKSMDPGDDLSYWLHSATLRIDQMFHELSRNSDALANALAAEILNDAENLPEVSTDHLPAHETREFGSALCTGQANHRNRNKKGSAAAK